MQEIAKLKTQYTSIQTKIKTARDFLLDFTITKEEYEKITTDLQVQKANTEHKIQVLSKADSEFNKSLGTIFELLSKAHKLFKSSEIEEKRRIITIMFPNLFLDKEKLIITPRKPFDLFLKEGGYTNWQTGWDSNPR
jgi:site-specific DNA recombinase